MSLLDQLSSLCIHSTYTNSLSMIQNNQPEDQTLQKRQNLHLSYASIHNTNTINEQNSISNHHYNSQQKVIQLFSDDQLKPTWRFNKTDNKISQSQQKSNVNQVQHQPSQFITQNNNRQKDNQSLLLMNLTKMSYMIKNKLRKIDYQFFVRLENYSKQIKSQNEQQQKINKSNKQQQTLKCIDKLIDTIGVISLKYSHMSECINLLDSQNHLSQAFEKIRVKSQVIKRLNRLTVISKKVIQRESFNKIQQHNKKLIKIDLFYSLINSVISKKLQDNQRCFIKTIKLTIQRNKMKKIEEIDINAHNEDIFLQQQVKLQTIQQIKSSVNNNKQQHINQSQYPTLIINSIAPIAPLNHIINPQIKQKSKSLFINIKQEKGSLTFPNKYPYRQNIPLKLHSLKTHDQQINLNDCVDNGHLLMTQIKANTTLKKQLENLTISNINSKTSNTSLNSSFLTSDNFIQQFNYNNKNNNSNDNNYNGNDNNNNSNDITNRTQDLSNTMRKSVNSSHQKVKTATLIPSSSNQTKQPRKSLVITKRKQSMNQFYTNTLYNTDRQKNDTNNKKKVKSTTNSSNKINHNKQSTSTNDKDIIKRMLQQLNQKFQCHDKIINITLSNKKPTSTQKKQSNTIINSSGKKVLQTGKKVVQRKKVNSQFIPTNNFTSNIVINQRQNSLKNSKVSINDNNKNEIKNKDYQNNVSICFMPVKINNNNVLNVSKKETLRNSVQPQQQRMKQSRSQITKKNSLLSSQGSQDSEICKILSKYRPKKALFPEPNLKIDLLPNQNQNIIDTLDTQKQTNYYLSLAKPQSRYEKMNDNSFLNNNKYKNSIFFRDSSLNDSERNVSLNTSQLSLITPKQSIRESFFSKKHSNQHLSADRDSAIAQYISYLPQQKYFLENQQENNSVHYTSLKLFDKKDPSQPTYYFQTGSKKQLFKPNSSSMQKKRTSFDKNKDEWDLMFQKQKQKFLKIQQVPKMTKKKSLLNEEVISEIKNKIQQCFILSQKDQNTIKTDLTLKKQKNQSLLSDQKYNQTTKNISQQSSKKNSLSKLYTTLNKLKRPQA